jgi:hypothetical protein
VCAASRHDALPTGQPGYFVTPFGHDAAMNENESHTGTDGQLQLIAPEPQQLELAIHDEVPVQFRLDEVTRRRGLRHVAELRRQIAAQAATRRSTKPFGRAA